MRAAYNVLLEQMARSMGRETPFLAKISLFRHKIGPAFVFREFWIKKFWQHLVSRTFLDKISVLLEHPAYSVRQEKPFYVKIGHVTFHNFKGLSCVTD